MDDLFPQAVAIILTLEGVYSNDPSDPGAETKWGIARAEHPEIPDATWASFTRDDALAIYRNKYWDANRCGEMPWPWALCVFDGEVNQGSVIALCQRCLGVKVDGIVGSGTLVAMAISPDENLNLFMALRAKAYIALPRFPYDGDGWFKRLFAVRAAAALPPANDGDTA